MNSRQRRRLRRAVDRVFTPGTRVRVRVRVRHMAREAVVVSRGIRFNGVEPADWVWVKFDGDPLCHAYSWRELSIVAPARLATGEPG